MTYLYFVNDDRCIEFDILLAMLAVITFLCASKASLSDSTERLVRSSRSLKLGRSRSRLYTRLCMRLNCFEEEDVNNGVA